MKAFETVGVVARDRSVEDSLIAVKSALAGHGTNLVMEERTATMLPDGGHDVLPRGQLGEHCDLIIVVGGDGSLLEKSHSFDRFTAPGFSDQSNEVEIIDLTLPDGRNGRRISIKFIPQIDDDNRELRDSIPLQDRPRAILRVSSEREILDHTIQQFHLTILAISLVVRPSANRDARTAARPGPASPMSGVNRKNIDK